MSSRTQVLLLLSFIAIASTLFICDQNVALTAFSSVFVGFIIWEHRRTLRELSAIDDSIEKMLMLEISIDSIDKLVELKSTIRQRSIFILARKMAERFSWAAHRVATPRSWRLIGYIIPPKSRREMYEPALEEYIRDYELTRRKYRTKLARGWLQLCYTFWTLYLVAQCLLLMLSSPLVKLWVKLTGLTYGQKDD